MQSEFTHGKIGIRRYKLQDLDSLFAGVQESIAELTPWMPWCHAGYSTEDCKNWLSAQEAQWEKGEEYSFMIFEVESGALLGGIGLHHVIKIDRCANLGYWVRTSRTRQGIAPAAARLIARFGFEQLNFNRLEIIIAARNKASQRVAEKIGAKREAVLRKRMWLDGSAEDALMFSLVREDIDA